MGKSNPTKKASRQKTAFPKHVDLNPSKIKRLLDIMIDISRINVDVVSTCLVPNKHKKAVGELNKLRVAIEAIWAEFEVNIDLSDCQKGDAPNPSTDFTTSTPLPAQKQPDHTAVKATTSRDQLALNEIANRDYLQQTKTSLEEFPEPKLEVEHDEESYPYQLIVNTDYEQAQSQDDDMEELASAHQEEEVESDEAEGIDGEVEAIDEDGNCDDEEECVIVETVEQGPPPVIDVDELPPSPKQFVEVGNNADTSEVEIPLQSPAIARRKGPFKCAAIACGNTKKERKDLKFFSFPSGQMRCNQWIINCRRSDLLEKSTADLKSFSFCALHFDDTQFTGPAKNRLRKNAVPTKFTFPNAPSDFLIANSQGEGAAVAPEDSQPQSSTAAPLPHPPLTEPPPAEPKGDLNVKAGGKEYGAVLLSRSDGPVDGRQLEIQNQPKKHPVLESCILRRILQSDDTLCCDKCGAKFRNKQNLLTHIKVYCGKKKPPPCDVFGYVFKELVLPKRPIYITSTKKKNIRRCKLCGEIFSSFPALNRHKRSSHFLNIPEPTPVQCDECGKLFSDKRGLRHHSWVHTGVKNYQCDSCNKSFVSEANMRRHKKEQHSGSRKQFLCDTCGQSFTQKSSLKEHQTNFHNEYHEQKRKIVGGRNNVANQSPTNFYPEIMKIVYKCSLCAFECSELDDFVQHRMAFHCSNYTGANIPNDNLKECPSFVLAEEKLYQCLICNSDNLFSDLSTLEKHMYHQHADRIQHARKNRFKCSSCDKAYQDKSLLKQHVDAIHNSVQFTCSECHKVFNLQSNLMRHQRIHKSIKPYQCEVCDRRFGQRSTLNLHSWTHKTEKRFNCEVCGQGYNEKRAFMAHVNRLHKDQDVSLQSGTGTSQNQHVNEDISAVVPQWPYFSKLLQMRDSL